MTVMRKIGNFTNNVLIISYNNSHIIVGPIMLLWAALVHSS